MCVWRVSLLSRFCLRCFLEVPTLAKPHTLSPPWLSSTWSSSPSPPSSCTSPKWSTGPPSQPCPGAVSAGWQGYGLVSSPWLCLLFIVGLFPWLLLCFLTQTALVIDTEYVEDSWWALSWLSQGCTWCGCRGLKYPVKAQVTLSIMTWCVTWRVVCASYVHGMTGRNENGWYSQVFNLEASGGGERREEKRGEGRGGADIQEKSRSWINWKAILKKLGLKSTSSWSWKWQAHTWY